MPSSGKLLPIAKRGDPILASVENDIRSQLNLLSGVGSHANAKFNSAIRSINEIGTLPLNIYVAYIGSTAVPARSGTTPGTLDLPIYTFDRNDNLSPVERRDGDPVEYPVLNLSESDSGTDQYVVVLQESEGQRYVLLVGSGESTDDGYPPSTDGCPCDECFEGVDIPDAVPETDVCCKGHPARTMMQPWLDAPVQGELELKYIGLGLWATDPFEGADCSFGATTTANEYRYLMTPSATAGASTIELELVTDNGCDIVCMVFVATLPYRCLCTNTFELVKWDNVSRDRVACRVCDKPDPIQSTPMPCAGCFEGEVVLPLNWEVDLGSGITNGQITNCSIFEGVHQLTTFADPYDTFGIEIAGPAAVAFIGTLEGTPALDGRLAFLVLRCAGGMGAFSVYAYSVDVDLDITGILAIWRVIDPVGCDQEFFNPDFTQSVQLESYYGFPDGTPFAGGPPTCATGPTTITAIAVDPSPSPSSDGSCAGCTTDTGIPATTGCCYNGECFGWDEPLCDDFGGEFFADIADCETDCNPAGVCCAAGGFCIDPGTEYECGLYGGTFILGGDCSDCTAPTGACCRSDGSCEEVEQADCVGAGENYYGDGTTCVGKSCLGACCCDNDSCCYGDSFTYDTCIDSGFGPTPQCGGGLVVPTFVIDGDCTDCADATICS